MTLLLLLMLLRAVADALALPVGRERGSALAGEAAAEAGRRSEQYTSRRKHTYQIQRKRIKKTKGQEGGIIPTIS
jgi:hypothetical protein